MKRITAAVLTVMLILCGCGQKEVVNNDKGNSDSENIVADTFDTPDSDTDTELTSEFEIETDEDIVTDADISEY